MIYILAVVAAFAAILPASVAAFSSRLQRQIVLHDANASNETDKTLAKWVGSSNGRNCIAHAHASEGYGAYRRRRIN